jgi:hypothetical protein
MVPSLQSHLGTGDQPTWPISGSEAAFWPIGSQTAAEGVRADRERALLCVGYDTMARRSELVALDVEDFNFMEDGSGRVLIRRSKTDQTGEGSKAYLSPDTVGYLKVLVAGFGN